MPIGTAERPINIKDLILDTPERERELPFDPERDVMKEDWDWVKLRLNGMRSDIDTAHAQHRPSGGMTHRDFLTMVGDVKLLRQEKGSELGIDSSFWGATKALLEELQATARWELIADLAAAMKRFDPQSFERILDLLLPQPEGRKPLLDALRERHRVLKNSSRSQGGICDTLVAFKILFADSLHKPGYGGVVDAHCSMLRTWILEVKQRGDWLLFTHRAADFRLLVPKHIGELEIDEYAWGRMYSQLQESRVDSLPGTSPAYPRAMEFLRHALSMKILAAEEAQINDQGLIEITMRKPKQDFAPQTPPMPEVRRF